MKSITYFFKYTDKNTVTSREHQPLWILFAGKETNFSHSIE